MNLAMAVSVPQCSFVGLRHSTLTHHGKCCDLAKQWLSAMHRSMTFSRTDGQILQAPLWLNRRYKWGPVQWPISWCEAVQLTAIDCGVFAAFALEIFERRISSQALGDYEVFPAQVILEQPKSLTEQWRVKWNPIFGRLPWIEDYHVYHEVCALVDRSTDSVRIFDPTEGVWIEPGLQRGVNHVIGVNIRSNRMLDWGSMRIGLDQWHLL